MYEASDQHSQVIKYFSFAQTFGPTSTLRISEMTKGGISAASPSDKNVKSKPEDDSTSTGKSEASELKKARSTVREQFTKTKNLALARMKELGSRTFIRTLLDKAIALNEESESMTRKMATLIPSENIEADCTRQD